MLVAKFAHTNSQRRKYLYSVMVRATRSSIPSFQTNSHSLKENKVHKMQFSIIISLLAATLTTAAPTAVETRAATCDGYPDESVQTDSFGKKYTIHCNLKPTSGTIGYTNSRDTFQTCIMKCGQSPTCKGAEYIEGILCRHYGALSGQLTSTGKTSITFAYKP